MNFVSIKKTICVISDEALKQLRAQHQLRCPPSMAGTLLADRVWREIHVIAKGDCIEVNLSNVDEEAAHNGNASKRDNCVQLKFSWSDLYGVQALEHSLRFEPLLVAKKTLAILAHVRVMSSEVMDVLDV